MIGTISAFYYALLTHRAFQLHAWGELPGFEVSTACPSMLLAGCANPAGMSSCHWPCNGFDSGEHHSAAQIAQPGISNVE